MESKFGFDSGVIPGWPQVRVALSCLRVATAGGHYSRFAHHAIDTAQAYRPEESRLRFAPTKIVLSRTLGGTGGSDGRPKTTTPSPTPSTAARPYRWRQRTAKSSPTSDRSQHSKSNTHRAFPAGELYPSPGRYRRAYLGLPPPKRQHSSGDCLIRLAACALLAINRRLTNHRPHRRGGGVEAEVDRVAFDTSFHHGFSTG